MTQTTPAETGYWTLAQLAVEVGVTPDALRQRIGRQTLAATKAGTTWLVDQQEAERAMRASRYWQARQAAQRIVSDPKRRKMPRGVDQHGGRA